MNKYIVTIRAVASQDIPVFADSLDEALEWAEDEYGEDNVERVRPSVPSNHQEVTE